MTTLATHRTSLRLDRETALRIERDCRRDGDRLTVNKWVARAIAEKLARYEVNSESTSRSERHGPKRNFLEFFCGGGMARAGLGESWSCTFANDISPMKARTYRDNWAGGHELRVGDINQIEAIDLPGIADLVWASFPCQDLSLAGTQQGLGENQPGSENQPGAATRSGTFWPFWRLMQALIRERRGPAVIVLENVYGVLTTHQSQDFAAIGSAFAAEGYRFGAVLIDARHFLPQSRPRVFIVGVAPHIEIDAALVRAGPASVWQPKGIMQAFGALKESARQHWVWWHLPQPNAQPRALIDLIEAQPDSVDWHSNAQTERLISMMSLANLEKLNRVKASRRATVGTLYRRTRKDGNGNRVQRTEVRFDNVAGCLRTPAGGSSRQSILLVDGQHVRSRLLSSREVARLMGLPDTYVLPVNYNDAYHIAGDGVAVPVVRFLADALIEPLLTRTVDRAEIEPGAAP